MTKTRVLFVCLGNICRSPMAEGLFLEKVKSSGNTDEFIVESAGTASYHIGELPDQRMRQTARKHGIDLVSRARQFEASDFHKFDYIIPMDRSNEKNIARIKPVTDIRAEVYLMRMFDDDALDDEVPDPYYGGDDGFEHVFQILDRATENLLNHILSNNSRNEQI